MEKNNKHHKFIVSLLFILIMLIILILVPSFAYSLSIELDQIPEYASKNKIDIKGKVADITAPLSKISVIINGEAKRVLADNLAGDFLFMDVELNEGENKITIQVANDKNEITEKTVDVTVDTSPPIIKIEEVPKIVREPAIEIKGGINEPGSIKVTARLEGSQPSKPPKVAGLKRAEASTKIILEWNPAGFENFPQEEFKYYVVYRDDIPIKLIGTHLRAQFEDLRVLSEKEYTYRVSVMSKFGVEGEKSEPLKAMTAKDGGKRGNKGSEIENYNEINIFEGTKGFDAVAESTNFPIAVPLDKGDGSYIIKIEAEDRAGNKADKLATKVKLDTKPLAIELISPQRGARIFENRANNLNIRGVIKPGAKIHLLVFRNIKRTAPPSKYSIDITGLPNELHQLFGKAGFNVECRGPNCDLEPSKSATADEKGEFVFEDVDLTPALTLGTNSEERGFTEVTRLQDFQDRSAKIVLVAFDEFEVVQLELPITIVNCWSPNQAWLISTEFQDPSILSTERIAEDTENLYILFKFNYAGSLQGLPAEVKSISINPACDFGKIDVDEEGEPIKDRFQRGCELLKGAFTRPVVLGGNMAYAILKLNRKQGMERWIGKEWKEWLEPFKPGSKNEITFPLKISINYNEDVDGNGEFNTIRRDPNLPPNYQTPYREIGLNQQSCHEVTYFIDTDKLNPQEVLPDWLLVDFSSLLEKSSGLLGDVEEDIIEPAVNIAKVGCVGSFIAKFFLKVYRTTVTKIDDFKIRAQPILDLLNGAGAANELGELSWNGFNDELECRQLILELNAKGKGLKDVRDSDLKKCFPRSYNAWELEAGAYQAFRWSCDRLFGHTAPARWTENVGDDEIAKQVKSNINCKVDRSVLGEYQRPVKCKDVATKFGKKADDYEEHEKCFAIFDIKSNDHYLYKLEEAPHKGNIHEITIIKIPGEKYHSDYAARVDKNTYVLPQIDNCADVCKNSVISKKRIGDGAEITKIGEDTVKITRKVGGEPVSVRGECITVDRCNQLKSDSLTKKYEFDNKNRDFDVLRAGFTKNCFYDNTKSLDVVSLNNPNTREECCCIVEKGVEKQTNYFEPTDLDFKGDKLHESKEKGASEAQSLSLDDIKFSYRYYTEGFNVNEGSKFVEKNYNPYRYIEGRDLPACFGKNYLFKDNSAPDVKRYAELNPYTNHLTSLQCLYLGGIKRNVNVVKNIMDEMNRCLVDIRTSGNADAGNCKELFSHRLCSLFWDALSLFSDKCSADIEGGVYHNSEDISSLGALRSSISQADFEAREEFRKEYPTVIAQGSNIFGIGGSSVSRQICLGAIGYDWGAIMENIGDISYTTPTGAVAQALFPRRRHITIEPVTGYSRYEYRTGIYIDSGCPVSRYEVALSCVGNNEAAQFGSQIDCSKVGDAEGGSGCDCLDQNMEQGRIKILNAGGPLKPNEVEDVSLQQLVTSPYRYDHIRIKLWPDPRIGPETRNRCFKEGYEQGVYYFSIADKSGFDIPSCRFDDKAGLVCESEFAFNRYGSARFDSVSVKIEGKAVKRDMKFVRDIEIQEGQRVDVLPVIINQKREKCLRVSVDNVDGGNLYSEAYSVPAGTYDFPDINIQSEQLVIFKEPSIISGADHIKVSLVENNNQKQEDILIKLVDKDNKDTISIELDGSSNDLIIIDNNEITISNIRNFENKIIINNLLVYRENSNNGNIVIQKGGAKIKITGAELPVNPDGATKSEVLEQISIAPKSGTKSEQKIVRMKIFNLYPESEGTDFSVSDCDFSSPAKIGEDISAIDAEHSIIVSIRQKSKEGKIEDEGEKVSAEGGHADTAKNAEGQPPISR